MVSQIKKRFDFSDKLYSLIEVVNPVVAQKFEVKSLKPVLSQFPFISNFVDDQQLDNEWRQHALLDFNELQIQTDDAEKYWRSVFSLKNTAGRPIFENLQIIIRFFLILPFSNVSVERLFSDLNLIKTDHRNSLDTENIAAILYTKQGILRNSSKGILQFEPNKKMLNCNIWKKK